MASWDSGWPDYWPEAPSIPVLEMWERWSLSLRTQGLLRQTEQTHVKVRHTNITKINWMYMRTTVRSPVQHNCGLKVLH